jgi:hypothetical protein
MIWFTAKPDVQVLKVYPARCALVSAHFTDGAILQCRKMSRQPTSDPRIRRRQAYYLGDYFARGIHKQHFYWRSQSWRWTPAARSITKARRPR